MSDTLRSKLQESGAVLSLRTEQRVADKLRALGWNAVHGFFYRDEESSKHREVDVAATIYTDNDESSDEFRITLVVECKSGLESNIIVTPHLPPHNVPEDVDLTPSISTQAKVIASLQAELRGTSSQHVPLPETIEAYNTLWRRFSRFLSLTLTELEYAIFEFPPPSADLVTTAYRETSGLKEKELDNSVLWRAYQGVYSAIAALQAEFVTYVSNYALQVYHEAWQKDRNVYNALSTALSRGFGMTQHYHPVIVTHANLWVLDGDELVAVPRFRFLQVDSLGLPFQWVDVVSVGAFDEFADTLTNYYVTGLKAGAHSLTSGQMLYRFLTEEA